MRLQGWISFALAFVMRILKISDVFFPRVNGVSTSIETFRRDLVALGHEVVLLADPGARSELGVQAREYAESWASIKMAQRLSALYASLAPTTPR
jgi:hypothetical protein